MPKVSKVGKFRKTAAAAAAAAASAMEVDSTTTKKNHGKSSPDDGMEMDGKPRRRKVERSKSFTQIMQKSTSTSATVAAASASAKSIKDADTANTNKNDTSTAESTTTTTTTTNTPKDTALSRGQRRRQAKREQYLKRDKMIMSSLKLKQEEDQKKRIDGLDALKAALLETVQDKDGKKEEEEVPPPSTTIANTNKAKRNIVASELHHMSLVMQHPAFQKNPFEAMQEHLKNTLKSQGEAQEKAGKEKVEQNKVAKEQRKQDRKERLRDMKGGRTKKKQRAKFKATRSRGKK